MAVTGNNQLVSVSDDGEVCSWNLESGALRARRTPPGHADLPLNEQAIERIEFLTGRLQHVFVTVSVVHMCAGHMCVCVYVYVCYTIERIEFLTGRLQHVFVTVSGIHNLVIQCNVCVANQNTCS